MHTGIYKIENLLNGKIYVGSTSAMGFTRRWRCHRNQLRINKHPNAHLQHAWNKYGETNFKFEIIESCSSSDCIVREQHYFNTLKPQYNIHMVAGSARGYRHTTIAKQKIGSGSRGKNNAAYSGEYTFYHPKHGYFTGGLVDFSTKFNLSKMTASNLKNEKLNKSHEWIYIGKHPCQMPKNIDEFYYNRIYDNRPIYSFYNKEKGIFTGTIPDFIKTNHIIKSNRSTVERLVKRTRKMAWGWIFIGAGIHIPSSKIDSLYANALKQNSKANSIVNATFTFNHFEHGIFVGTPIEFSKKYNLHDKCVRRLVRGGRKQYCGWTIKS